MNLRRIKRALTEIHDICTQTDCTNCPFGIYKGFGDDQPECLMSCIPCHWDLYEFLKGEKR